MPVLSRPSSGHAAHVADALRKYPAGRRHIRCRGCDENATTPVASRSILAVNSPPRARLHLVRHCDVRNPEGVLYGHLPDFPLSEKGVRQAHALGRYFTTTNVRQIYTSPLLRARQTADIIASHLAQVPITETEDLIEAKFGRYLQGVKPSHVPWRRPLWFIHMVWPGLLSGDESVGAMADRVRRPLLQLLRDFPGEGGICVSHGDPIQAFWIQAEGRPPYALHRLQCAKGGVLELDYEGENLLNITYRSPRSLGEPEATLPTAAHH
jgi:broad specificity phosphatase PhoE